MTSKDEYTFTVNLTRTDQARMDLYTNFRTRHSLVRLLLVFTFFHFFIRWVAYNVEGLEIVGVELIIWLMTLLAILIGLAGIAISLFVTLFVFVDKRLYRPFEFIVSAKCVQVKQGGTKAEVAWEYFVDIRTTPKHCFLYVTRFSAHNIPKRCMPTGTDWDEFCAFCKEQFQLAKAHAEQ